MVTDKRLNAIGKIELAYERAVSHLAGVRDQSLDPQFDDLIQRFAEQLKEMRQNLLSGGPKETSQNMTHAICDCWPFESELGTVITAAEDAYNRTLKDSRSSV